MWFYCVLLNVRTKLFLCTAKNKNIHIAHSYQTSHPHRLKFTLLFASGFLTEEPLFGPDKHLSHKLMSLTQSSSYLTYHSYKLVWVNSGSFTLQCSCVDTEELHFRHVAGVFIESQQNLPPGKLHYFVLLWIQTQISHFNLAVYVYPNSENYWIKKDARNLIYIPLSQKILRIFFFFRRLCYLYPIWIFYLFKFPAIGHCGNHLSEFLFLTLQHSVYMFDWHLQEEIKDAQQGMEFVMFVTCLKLDLLSRDGKQHYFEPIQSNELLGPF